MTKLLLRVFHELGHLVYIIRGHSLTVSLWWWWHLLLRVGGLAVVIIDVFVAYVINHLLVEHIGCRILSSTSSHNRNASPLYGLVLEHARLLPAVLLFQILVTRSLYLLKILVNFVQLLLLVFQLLLILVSKLLNFLLEVYLLVIRCWIKQMRLAVPQMMAYSSINWASNVCVFLIRFSVISHPWRVCIIYYLRRTARGCSIYLVKWQVWLIWEALNRFKYINYLGWIVERIQVDLLVNVVPLGCGLLDSSLIPFLIQVPFWLQRVDLVN